MTNQQDYNYDEKKRILKGLNHYTHRDINGNLVDIRTIDSRYASNLYRFYIRAFKDTCGKDLNTTLFMQTLIERMGGEEMTFV